MHTSELITGILLIICGLLVKQFPNLIAGYNTLTKKDKEKIDIEGYSTLLRNALVGLGIIVIIIGFILKLIDVKEHYSILISSTLIILTVLYITFKGGSYIKRE